MNCWIKGTKKVCWILNYIENLIFLASAAIRCVSITVFTSLVSISAGVMGSAGLKTCAITSEIKT